MRPFHLFLHDLLSPCSSPGLIKNGDVGYDRQELPVEAVRPSRPALLGAQEIEMKPEQPQRDASNQSGSFPPAGGQDFQPETRAERLERIRLEIEAGTYETPEKLEAAVDRMLGVLTDASVP
jgi:hypothetical protein